ncbi:MAG: DmsE family decaheme c-type cytochrome [Rhodocyclales bacterium]|nr:DmsE family decaheme c-type cytochrome [Rhodocyclales bacterium]
MRSVRQLLTFCAVIGTLAAATPSLAAADAPKRDLVANPNAKDLVLKGDAKCTGCHDEADEPTGKATMLELNPGVLAIGTTRHGVKGDSRTPTCTDCHGESKKHIEHKGSGKPPVVDRSYRKNTPTAAVERNAACMTCHTGGKQTHWENSLHARNEVACNSCHTVHSQHDKVRSKKTQTEVCFTCHKEQRAELQKISAHPIKEGKISCSNCHNPHGSPAPSSLTRNTVTETCYQCHAEKRGPFLWEHQPAVETCATCHSPHGSNITSLLKSRPPFLCTECHDGPHSKGAVGPIVGGFQAGYTGADPRPTSPGKSCMNCHVMVHGSNSPAGAWLQR